jgi:hypothetical protein
VVTRAADSSRGALRSAASGPRSLLARRAHPPARPPPHKRFKHEHFRVSQLWGKQVEGLAGGNDAPQLETTPVPEEEDFGDVSPPPPLPLVLIGHAASFTPY